MDTTKEYIKMCDCPEVQDKCPIIRFGDAVSYKSVVRWRGLNGWDEVFDTNRSLYIVLPRQDQIQGWFKLNGWETISSSQKGWIIYWTSKRDNQNMHSVVGETIEQCLLQVYMSKEKGYTWTGKVWEINGRYRGNIHKYK